MSGTPSPCPECQVTPGAWRAAVYLNTQTDGLLRKVGVNPGPMTQSNHCTTAQIIDREAGIPALLEALEACCASLEVLLDFGDLNTRPKLKAIVQRDIKAAKAAELAAKKGGA